MTTTDTEVTVTPEDIAAWERYGPAIFHCEMTGPEALARHRTLTPAQAAGPVLLEALAKGGFMMTETHNVGEHRGRKLVIGFQNADDADLAMQAVAEALVAWRAQS